MAAISADSGSEKRWGRVVSFNLSSGARKAASMSQRVLWSTGKAAWIAGASFLFLVAPLVIKMEQQQQQQQQAAVPDLEGGDHHHQSTTAVNPDSPSVLK